MGISVELSVLFWALLMTCCLFTFQYSFCADGRGSFSQSCQDALELWPLSARWESSESHLNGRKAFLMFHGGGSLRCSLYCSMLSLPACADPGRQGSLALAQFVKADKAALSHRGKPEGWILATAPLSSNPWLVLLKDHFYNSAVSQAVILCPTLGLALWAECLPWNAAWAEVAVPFQPH